MLQGEAWGITWLPIRRLAKYHDNSSEQSSSYTERKELHQRELPSQFLWLHCMGTWTWMHSRGYRESPPKSSLYFFKICRIINVLKFGSRSMQCPWYLNDYMNAWASSSSTSCYWASSAFHALSGDISILLSPRGWLTTVLIQNTLEYSAARLGLWGL